jgi:hypothetical protein
MQPGLLEVPETADEQHEHKTKETEQEQEKKHKRQRFQGSHGTGAVAEGLAAGELPQEPLHKKHRQKPLSSLQHTALKRQQQQNEQQAQQQEVSDLPASCKPATFTKSMDCSNGVVRTAKSPLVLWQHY